jgi:hypothetical protein
MAMSLGGVGRGFFAWGLGSERTEHSKNICVIRSLPSSEVPVSFPLLADIEQIELSVQPG